MNLDYDSWYKHTPDSSHREYTIATVTLRVDTRREWTAKLDDMAAASDRRKEMLLILVQQVVFVVSGVLMGKLDKTLHLLSAHG